MQGALPDPDAAALAKGAGALAFAAGRLDDALKSYTGQVVPHPRSGSLNTVAQEVSTWHRFSHRNRDCVV